jgi:flagellar basal-body rod modification protein FlgD
MVAAVTAPATNPYAALNAGSSASTPTTNEAASSDRFLKLLVTQMQNQDPLNPMDNAQITSQMAQINTVNGVEKLNTTVQGLNTQFSQLQALTGAALVGRQVTLAGNKLNVDGNASSAAFDLSGNATDVKVEVLSSAGRVVDTMRLGPMDAGRHEFSWQALTQADGSPYSYRVTALRGTAAVTSTTLMHDRVDAINTDATGLTLETRNTGPVAYSDVKAIN